MSKDLRDARGEIERLSRGDPLSHFVPLDLGQESGAKSFSREELHQLSKSYIEHAHPLHPFFDKPQHMCNEFINNPFLQRGIINPCLRNVHVLFFFALGSCQSVAKNTCRSSTMPGIAYYSCAKAILKYKLGERNIPVAQALTLAALYMNQNGMLHDSLTYLYNARDIYIDVVKT